MIILLLCPLTGIAGSTNDYASIWQRNAFALRPALIVTNVSPPAAPSASVKLLGLAAVPPQKWAVLQVQEPGKPAASVMLKEGTRAAALEMLEIDSASRRVVFRNGGTITALTFEKSGAKSPARIEPDRDHTPLPLIPDPAAGDP